MTSLPILPAIVLVLLLTGCASVPAVDNETAQLGPRPFYLLNTLPDGELKSRLEACKKGPFVAYDFSIGHRGAPMQFPEHTKESYEAAAIMGAGILECDVTFTADGELVCRHAQCDLHQTTDILLKPELAQKCRQPFVPAEGDQPASAQCCTSDITLAEFKTLCGKMDGFNPAAKTAEEFVQGTPGWRTDLYSQCGTVLSHKESVALFQQLGRKMTPELKAPQVNMPFTSAQITQPYSREQNAQQLVDELRQAGVPPENVWLQSFEWSDIEYWLTREPELGRQAVWLVEDYAAAGFDPLHPPTWLAEFTRLKSAGLNIIAPAQWMLVQNQNGRIAPSDFAVMAKQAGLQIISWSLERSGPLYPSGSEQKGGGWYYQSIGEITRSDAVTLELLHVLAQDVGVIGVFSDWPATTTFYANCML
ncbi:glycerophosphodiester phosphodiesterase family protein [Venatoribacter cucullus]|uniref:glycerophosphodiester phosphodiesterase family protein n=1 Tax=Venatoribacter cucullus TaxID=2661630 RepID=UPI002240A5DF|nr:glycerophosphodiester phosphodiesterase family protein [Venatoribacter cucullus]UZK04549.1 glycerophosphodiester phosphodiesterase [Venatoribacter cucullus]